MLTKPVHRRVFYCQVVGGYPVASPPGIMYARPPLGFRRFYDLWHVVADCAERLPTTASTTAGPSIIYRVLAQGRLIFILTTTYRHQVYVLWYSEPFRVPAIWSPPTKRRYEVCKGYPGKIKGRIIAIHFCC